jgi:ATP-dependent exoDNAse (exonuclease V) alpha subunit
MIKLPGSFCPHNPLQAANLMKSLARKKQWGIVFDIKKKWLDLRPAFASTVHKSQGSTYDTVYINLTDIGKCRVPSDVARMLYVAITRAAKKVVLYGELPFIYSGAYHAQKSIAGVPA